MTIWVVRFEIQTGDASRYYFSNRPSREDVLRVLIAESKDDPEGHTIVHDVLQLANLIEWPDKHQTCNIRHDLGRMSIREDTLHE